MSSTETSIIAFEGPPLMGKTTQASRLESYLEDQGYEVEVLKRATEYCPTREEINELRAESDGWTRDLDRITPGYETQLWAQYYREKTKAVHKIVEEQNPDFILVDRYFLSLIPTQEPVLDQDLIELAEEYAEEINQLRPDIVFLLNSEDDLFQERFQKREGKRIAEDLLSDMKAVREHYNELVDMFDLVRIEADRSKKEVHEELLGKLASRNLD